MNNMNVSLPPKLGEYVHRKLEGGLYGNASEVLREGLRLLIARDEAGREPPLKSEIRAELAAMEETLRKEGVTTLSLFGSLVRGEAQADSDIDVLIEVAPEADFDLLDLSGVQHLIEDRLNRKVDVLMKGGIRPAFEPRILREAEAVF